MITAHKQMRKQKSDTTDMDLGSAVGGLDIGALLMPLNQQAIATALKQLLGQAGGLYLCGILGKAGAGSGTAAGCTAASVTAGCSPVGGHSGRHKRHMRQRRW